jgi:hypothetical protein
MIIYYSNLRFLLFVCSFFLGLLSLGWVVIELPTTGDFAKVATCVGLCGDATFAKALLGDGFNLAQLINIRNPRIALQQVNHSCAYSQIQSIAALIYS